MDNNVSIIRNIFYSSTHLTLDYLTFTYSRLNFDLTYLATIMRLSPQLDSSPSPHELNTAEDGEDEDLLGLRRQKNVHSTKIMTMHWVDVDGGRKL